MGKSNMIKIDTRRIKGTPYKVVLYNWQIIGIFDREVYTEKKNMTPELCRIADTFHAATLKERVTCNV